MLQLPQTLTQTEAKTSLAALSAHVTAQQPACVVVDASLLQRFDTTALAVLLALHRQVQLLGKTLEVQGVQPRLMDLAKLYGVATLLALVPIK